MSNNNTDSVTKATFDANKLKQAFSKIQQQAKVVAKVSIPKPLSTYRPQFKMRVTSIIKRADFTTLGGVITDVAGMYAESQDIKSYKEKVTAKVIKCPGDMSRDEMIIFPTELDDVQDNLKHYQEKKIDVIWDKSLRDTIVFHNGDAVMFGCDQSVEKLKPFAEILVGVSSSRYLTKPSDVGKGNRGTNPTMGVSNRIKEFEITQEAFPDAVFDMFYENPEAFGYPVPLPTEFLEDEKFKFVKIMDEDKKPKTCSSRIVYVPLFSLDDTLAIFGNNAGAMTNIEWTPKVAFSKERADKKLGSFLWANGKFVVTQWKSPKELTDFLDGKAQLHKFVGEFTMFSDMLVFGISNIGLWELMARSLFEQTPMIVACSVGLYKTADNKMNEKEDETLEHYLDFQPRQIICKFKETVIKDIGVPCSRNYMKTIVANEKFTAFEADPKQKSSNDSSFINCSEMTIDALSTFLESKKVADFEFFAVLSSAIAPPTRAIIRAVREWATTTKKDEMAAGNLPLCEMLLWDSWLQNVDDWVLSLGVDAKVSMPADHPILKPENKATLTQGTVVYYAVDMKARAAAKEVARKNPYSLTIGHKKQNLLTAGPATDAKATSTTTAPLSSVSMTFGAPKATPADKTEPLKEINIALPSKDETEHAETKKRTAREVDHDGDEHDDQRSDDATESGTKRHQGESPEVD